jgi:hypothetical protein
MKLWATPQATDGTRINQIRHPSQLSDKAKKGGCSNLREQVMYPTPTTKGYGHASMGQTMKFRKLVEKGHMTEKEAQAMMNGVTLRPPRMEEWKYPTPTHGMEKHSYNGNNQYYEKRLKDGRQIDLTMKMYQTEGDARLNADWTEWLMGYPIGWTNLEECQESSLTNKTESTDSKV